MADNIIRVYPGGQSALAGNATEASILAQVPVLVPAAVESSGVLNKNDIIPIVVTPGLTVAGKVWVKGNICFVSLCFGVPALANIVGTGFSVPLASGMPLDPDNNGIESGAKILGTLLYGRANFDGVIATTKLSGILTVTAGILRISSPVNKLAGNPTVGFNDFLTVSGHYLINLTDSNP